MNIAIITTEPEHFGSAVSPPISSTVNGSNFVTIEGTAIMDIDNTVDTPSHIYAYGPPPTNPPLFHQHDDQVIDTLSQTFVTIEGQTVIVEGDKYNAEDTRIVSAGQTFVSIT